MSATKLDPSSIVINLISANDESANSDVRSSEILDVIVEVIRLASKRGRVASVKGEASHEAA